MTRVVKRFENCTLDNYVCSTETQAKLVAELRAGIEKGFDHNIIIIGSVGTGKTHLAYALLNALAERMTSQDGQIQWYRENKVAFRPIKAVIDGIRASWDCKDCPNPLEDLATVPLLILDEIGMQYGTASERTELYELFNRRYEDMLPTIAISNNDKNGLLHILGQRIFDRLSGGASIYEIRGRSWR